MFSKKPRFAQKMDFQTFWSTFFRKSMTVNIWSFKSWILRQIVNSKLKHTTSKNRAPCGACPQNGGWKDSCHQNGIFTYFSSKTSNLEIFFSKISNIWKSYFLSKSQNLKIWFKNLKSQKSVQISNLRSENKFQKMSKTFFFKNFFSFAPITNPLAVFIVGLKQLYW